MSRRRLLLPALLSLLVFLAVAIVLLLVTGGSGPATPTSPVVNVPPSSPTETVPAEQGFDGAALPRPRAAPDFSLTDQYGRRVSLAALRGGPVVLAFLYARCGAPCVLIAQQIRGALDELGEHPAQVAIVSADPAGDTPSAVRSFLAQVSLSGRVHWLTGSAAALAAVWKAYDVRPAEAGRATFEKYATVRLLDSQGRERVLYGTEQLTPEALAHDIRKLQGSPARP
jgi:protein SCO1/2